MYAPLVATIASAVVVIALLVLFSVEKRRGARFLHGIRESFDTEVTELGEHLGKRYPKVASGTLRQSGHYLLHRVLVRLLDALSVLESAVRRALHLNKRRAARARTDGGSDHFTELRAHKQRAALSDEEKVRRKDEALNGR